MSRQKKVALVALVAAVAVIFGVIFVKMDDWILPLFGDEDDGSTAREAERAMNTVYVDGVAYLPKKNVEAILIIGLDKMGKAESNGSYYNNDQADFLMVAALNRVDKTCAFLQIDRNTMTEVSQLSIGGQKYDTVVQQIALAHTHGDGLDRSCLNTVDAVSHLLCGIKIPYYFSTRMDAVSLLNDAVGGVDVTLENDYPTLGEEYVAGATVHLRGEAALGFVRARKDADDQTNEARMARQRTYLHSLAASLLGDAHGESFWVNTYTSVSPYVVTNISTGTLQQVFSGNGDYTFSGIRTLEGESKIGDGVMEFYVDQADLKQQVISLFLQRADD